MDFPSTVLVVFSYSKAKQVSRPYAEQGWKHPVGLVAWGLSLCPFLFQHSVFTQHITPRQEALGC